MPVPPPPPPPMVFPKPEKAKSTEIHRLKPEDLDKIIERQFLLDKTLKEVFYKINFYLAPQLQEGPKCGLVALSIASSITKDVGVDSLLDSARSENFTKQGEIFDADYLSQIAEKCCGFTSTVIEGGLHKHFNCIFNNLLNKNLLLIPYDADHNHSPCCKEGFKAHWAVITGFVIFKSNEDSKSIKVPNVDKGYDVISLDSFKYPLCNCVKNCNFPNVHLNISCNEENILIEKKIGDNCFELKNIFKGKIFLIGLQGKSKYMGLWSFDDMAKSNDNLLCFCPDRDVGDYVLPEGGPAVGLKAVVIRKLPNSALDWRPQLLNRSFLVNLGKPSQAQVVTCTSLGFPGGPTECLAR